MKMFNVIIQSELFDKYIMMKIIYGANISLH